MRKANIPNFFRKVVSTTTFRMLLITLPIASCGGSGGESGNNGGDDVTGPPTSGSAPENRHAAHEGSIYTWNHANTEANSSSAVADGDVRTSAFYSARVAPALDQEAMKESVVYMSLPRSGNQKEGYSHEDGAEFADTANLTMSWTSFLFSEDAWLELEVLDGYTIESIDDVTIRPTRLDMEMELTDDNRLRIKVPYSDQGQRFSVEFDQDLMTSFNNLQGNTGKLTEGPDGAQVHTEPRNSLLVFAEPMLSDSDQTSLIPDDSDGDIYYPEPGEVDYLDNVDVDIIYFKPGTYYFPWNYHAQLHSKVRWVYLAPGAYVKGAFEFQGARADYKVTGYGVLSGENYVYEADPDSSDDHEPYTHRSDSRTDCHGSCVKMLRFLSSSTNQTLTIQGVTINEPPYHSFVIYGDRSNFQTRVSGYKQVGAWYWQTDGIELFDNGQLKDSFFHANDDVFKLYFSDLIISDVVVWKSENGPVFQWGWTPRSIENIHVKNIDIIHNRLYWKDQKHNTCLINSAKAWWDTNADNTGDPNTTIKNIHLENIRSEGMNLCAMRLFAQSNWENIHIDGLEIEAWSDLPVNSQESQFRALWNEDRSETVSIGEAEAGLVLENYVVDRQPVSLSDDNWRGDQLGRLNFSIDLWDSWTAIADKTANCTPQEITIESAGELQTGDSIPLSATASSGLPVRFYVLNGFGTIDDGMLTVGNQPGTITVAARQDGDNTYCQVQATMNVAVMGEEGVAPGSRWIGASWSDWTPASIPMEWDGDSKFTVSVTIPAGDQSMKFTDTEDWAGDDWAGSTGLTGTATLTTGGGDNIDFTIETEATYEISFHPFTLEYAITQVD